MVNLVLLKCMIGMGIFKLHIKGFKVGLIRISMIRAIYSTPINVKRWHNLSYWVMEKPSENHDSCSLHSFLCICTRYVKWLFYLEIMGIIKPWFNPYCNNGYWKYIEILCMRKTLPYWIILRNKVPYHKSRYA